MPSFQIHIAIGNIYLEKNKIKNKDDFLKGIVAPDLAIDKDISHYTDKRESTSLIEHLQTKVNLKRYLKENKIDSDYDKGYFLHLITDYEFFHNYFSQDYLNKISYPDFCQDLYYSYYISNEYLKNYSKLPDTLKELSQQLKEELKRNTKIPIGNENLILPEAKTFKFIQDISDINLEEYKKRVLED